jgi:hypothetical protein
VSDLFNAKTPSEAAAAMIALGWEPLPLQHREKKPAIRWAQPQTYGESDLAAAFPDTMNIGVALGARSGDLVDIDFDWPEAALVAKVLLPNLPSFGRPSSPDSHRLAIARLSGTGRLLYQLPAPASKNLKVDRSMVLEVRATSHQTMMPPSTHPSGERVSWSSDPIPVPTMDEVQLRRVCGTVAFLAVLLRFYPRVPGDRDNICLAAAGALARAGFSSNDVDDWIALVARLAGDEEWQQRGGKAEASRHRIEAGETTWGLPELCQRLGIEDLANTLRSWLGHEDGASTSVRTSREITINRGELHEAVDKAEEALIEGGVQIYQQASRLVRPLKIPKLQTVEGVRREAGQVILSPVASPWLLEQFGRAATWWRPGKGAPQRIDPPPGVASQYMGRAGSWTVPVLVAVTQTPTLRPDGSILQLPGYDAATGLLFEPGDVAFDKVPEHPSRDQALAALELLESPFREVAFADDASKSVVIAAILTALVRRVLPTAPLFALDAPTAGTGKSLIAETIGIIATGTKPALMAQGKNPEEDEKRLSSVLMAGDAVIVIDNCELPLTGDFLAQMLTAEEVRPRILGKSEVASVPTKSLVMATGNNLLVEGDMTRRVMISRLDAGMENPETRRFEFDPRAEASAQRRQLVVAGLTILRAYYSADRPVKVRPLGSFEDWSIIREALVWLGRVDPALTRERLVSADPKRGELAGLLATWFENIGDRPIRLNEVGTSHEELNLRAALISATGAREFNTKSIGRRLGQHVDRPVEGLVLRRSGSGSRGYEYRVQRTEPSKANQSPF